jgi:nucleotide-binding universal stress UspA family protein
MDFKTILVPADGSKPSKRALERAVYLSKVCKAEIILLYVADLNKKISSFEQVSIGGFLTSDLKEEGYETLTKLVRTIPPDIAVRPKVLLGAPTETIIEEAEACNADLIIMGSRGLGSLEKLVMGSVSQFVVQHAKCPVMTVQ